MQTFELIMSITHSARFQEHIHPAMEAVVYFTIPFLQATHEQEEAWAGDANQMVADEEEGVISARSSGGLLLEELVEAFEDHALRPISVAVQRRLLDSNSARAGGSPLWWRLREAAILAIGGSADKFIGSEMSGVTLFDSHAFLDSLLLHDLAPGGAAGLPLLYSRCLWACGRFCPVAGEERLANIIQRSIDSLDPARPAVVHVGACRALSRVIPNSPQGLLQHFVQQIYAGISALLPSATDEILRLLLELMETLIRAGKHATAAVEEGMTPAVLRIWEAHVSDPVISCAATDVLEAIADSPDCFAPLVSKALPFLRSILEGAAQGEDGDDDGKVAGAIEILTMLLKRSFPEALQPTYEATFLPLVRIMMMSSDHGELQNGAEAMAVFVRSAGESLLTWGKSPEDSMKLLLEVAARLLNPDLDPSASVFVGPYLEQLLSKFPSYIGPQMQLFVRALITRISSKSLPSLTIAVILVFARLIHTCDAEQRRDLVAFLATEQTGTAQGRDCSALEVLAKEWCNLQSEIQGRKKSNMAVSALALLLATQDSRLDSVLVEGCPVGPSGASAQTSPRIGSTQRIRARPSFGGPVLVPFPMKCFTFFAETLLEAEEERAQRQALQGAAKRGVGEDWKYACEEEDDDDDEESEDQESDASDDDGDPDLFMHTDFLRILQEYVMGIPEGYKAQVANYRDLLNQRQQEVLQHYFRASLTGGRKG